MAKTGRQPFPQAVIKALFARAGNRCSICQNLVTELPQVKGDRIIVTGQIAHINPISSDGPRGTASLTNEELNDYGNLILVCANCHSKIDRQEVTYSVEELRKIKKDHEDRTERLTAKLSNQEANSIVATYIKEFKYSYKSSTDQFIVSEYKVGDRSIIFDSENLKTFASDNLMVLGGSGRGKSLFAKQVALQSLEHGIVPIIIEAIQFSSWIEPSFEGEFGLTTMNFIDIEEACSILQKKVLLIIDGYNECPAAIAVKLNLWILAFANRQNVRVVITTQHQIEGLEDLNLKAIEIPAPDFETKKQIAALTVNDVYLEKITPLLNAVTTGLEAKLIGVVSKSVSPESSRFELFDLYARQRLGENEHTGINCLCVVAKYLYEKITFSLSIRDFDRVLSTNQISYSANFLFDSGLLIKRSQRVYFGHELFMHAFSSEAIVRDANGDPAKINKALLTPKHREQRAFILGAIDDRNLLNAVLAKIADFDLVAACIAGDCGSYAKQWVERQCDQLFEKINEEISTLTFEILDQKVEMAAWSPVSIVKGTLYDWSEQEIVFIHALPLLLVKGECVDEIFNSFRQFDKALVSEFTRLRPVAVERSISLRSNMFQATYLKFSGVETSVSMILANFNNGGWSMMDLKPSDILFDFVNSRIIANDLSNGQLYLVLQLVQLFRFRNEDWKYLLPKILPELLKDRWKFSPYHLKISLLDAAHYSWDIPTEQKQRIIDELNHLLEVCRGEMMMPTFILEALQALGGLEEDELAHHEVARNELTNILNGKNNLKNCKEAFGLHQRSFDHPYYGAYCHVINELPHDDTKRFYSMALRGVAKSSFGIPIAMYSLAKFEDPETSTSFIPFLRLPDIDSSMPQEAFEVFMLAHIILGWFRKEISFASNSTLDEPSRSISAFAEIMYWVNRRDLKVEVQIKYAGDAWQILLDHNRGAAVSALMNYDRIIKSSVGRFAEGRDIITSIDSVFPDHFAEIYRQGVIRAKIQKGYFRWTKTDEILSYAIQGLGNSGNLLDIPLLKEFVDTSSTAIEAIAKIESKFSE